MKLIRNNYFKLTYPTENEGVKRAWVKLIEEGEHHKTFRHLKRDGGDIRNDRKTCIVLMMDDGEYTLIPAVMNATHAELEVA
tara:strand:- start:574 stop:819 length:246 start_codon:yes stop_codon:yes gene_type:complete